MHDRARVDAEIEKEAYRVTAEEWVEQFAKESALDAPSKQEYRRDPRAGRRGGSLLGADRRAGRLLDRAAGKPLAELIEVAERTGEG